MRLFQHRCRVAQSVALHYRSPHAPQMSIGGTAAKAEVCSCGKVLWRELTPCGYQQLSWGGSYEEIMALLDEKIQAKRREALDAFNALPWWRRLFRDPPAVSP